MRHIPVYVSSSRYWTFIYDPTPKGLDLYLISAVSKEALRNALNNPEQHINQAITGIDLEVPDTAIQNAEVFFLGKDEWWRVTTTVYWARVVKLCNLSEASNAFLR